MLEAVVKKMELRTEFLFGKDPGLVAFFRNDYGYTKTSRHQHGFIAKMAG